MTYAPDDSWFTVKVRFDRQHGSIEISRPYVHEVEIINGTFFLRDKHGRDMEVHPFDEVAWYKVKPNERADIPEDQCGGDE